MHYMRNRMEYLVQHRLLDHAKTIISSIGLAKAQTYAPERNALYRAVWLQMCKVDVVAPGNQGWMYESRYLSVCLLFETVIPEVCSRDCLSYFNAVHGHLIAPTAGASKPLLPSRTSHIDLFTSFLMKITRRPQFLHPLSEPLSLQALASLAVLLYPPLRLTSLPPHIWSLIATPINPHFSFMRMAPTFVQNRFHEIFKVRKVTSL